MGSDEDYVEIWGDRIALRDLLIALVICAAPTIAALALGTLIGGQPLFWGMGGACLGFVIACLVIRPKRDVRIVDDPGSV